tara:strand:- start:1904 stop:2659 length:756 start_codon:yes stop_codon:yes gene_type:complete
MIKIVTPLSTLFQNKHKYDQIISSTDFFELRDRDLSFVDKKLVKFYHSEIQLNHPMYKEEIETIKKKLFIYDKIKYISFHIASNYSFPKIGKNKIFINGRKNLKRNEMIFNVKKNVKILKKNFPHIKIMVENNNFYNTGAYKFITDPEFISEVIYDNNINLLFDISHAIITAHNKKITLNQYLRNLPMDKTLQLHVSRPILRKNFYYDAHYLPKIDYFLRNLIKNHNIKFITFEYYKNFKNLVRLNTIINK